MEALPHTHTTNTAVLSAFKLDNVPILAYVHGSWVMTEKLPVHFHVQRAEMGFMREFTVWHFVTKCAAVKFDKP